VLGPASSFSFTEDKADSPVANSQAKDKDEPYYCGPFKYTSAGSRAKLTSSSKPKPNTQNVVFQSTSPDEGVGRLECEVEVSMENYENVESAMISFPCELTPCEVTEL